jgi:hypothetical protein
MSFSEASAGAVARPSCKNNNLAASIGKMTDVPSDGVAASADASQEFGD